ncbi:MAG: ATP-binding protein [Raoultibacter sp.]
MKKKSVLNLIKYHAEHNDPAFRAEAYEIAQEFDIKGDYQLAEYVMALLSDTNTFVPQATEAETQFLQKITQAQKPLPLPDAISEDIKGIINAVGHNAGVNKFLFQGPPGTGKTETSKQVARILERDLYAVDFSSIIDSKLGQTAKNISTLFKEINGFHNPLHVVILFDEIDALALDRTSERDIREMGRATSTFLKELESVNSQVVLIATTNLFSKFDKAMIRRFDYVVDFSRYSKEDLLDIAEILANSFLQQFKFAGKDTRLLRKILALAEQIPYPGELSNIIKSAIAFSNPDVEHDYLSRIYKEITGNSKPDVYALKKSGFTLREIETITGTPRSTLSRELKG